jgi:hypothetical protein
LGWKRAYPEHVLALAIENAGARLEALATEELGERNRNGVRRPRHYRLLLALRRVLVLMLVRVRVLMLVLVFAFLTLLLLLLLLLCLHPLLCLSLEMFCGC